MRSIAPGLGVFLFSIASIAAEPPAVVPWSDEALGFRNDRPEALAQGPAALAVDAQGRSLVLDRLHGRVVRVGQRLEASVPAAEDCELVAVGPDGAIATYSAVRARVELVSSTGAALGAIAVPRVLGPIRAIALGASNRVTVSVALQERYPLGSPSFPLPLAVVLAGKREGALPLSRDRGVSILVQHGVASLVVSTPTSDEPMVRTRSIASGIDAAQLVGADGNVVCAKLESLRGATSPGAAVDVARRLLCVDADSGAVRLDRALPAPGVYLPRAELAVGVGQVVLMTPGAAGLSLTRWSFEGGAR